MGAREVSFVLFFLYGVVLATAFFHHKPKPDQEEPSESPYDYPPSEPYPHHSSFPHHYPEYPPSYPNYYPSPYPYRKPYCRKPHWKHRMCGRGYCPRGTRCVLKTAPCFYPLARVSRSASPKSGVHTCVLISGSLTTDSEHTGGANSMPGMAYNS
uniref:Uncharacterized protein n=1 Tax=Amblyomma triste TaxID=251400 RepID=A0A023G2I7_AMBTT